MDKKPFVASTREERLKGAKLVVILEQACLELVENKNRDYALLNSQDHRELLKATNREPEDIRPDITHQCLISLLDSPLNRSGKLCIFIRTTDNQLIEVSPQLTVPRTWYQFQAMMITFLQRRSIKAEETSTVLLRYIKNNLEDLLPPGCYKLGLSATGTPINFTEYCKKFKKTNEPIAFFVGAVAKSNPTSKEACKIIEDCIQISPHHLTAAVCCGKICNEFEYLWKVL